MDNPDCSQMTNIVNKNSIIDTDLRFKYLEIRNTNYKALPLFLNNYPDMALEIINLEEQIYFLAKYLHSIYMQIFITFESDISVSKEERHILNMIHKRYLVTKQRTTPSRINDILAKISPTKLNKLLKKFNKTDHRLPKIIN